MSSSQHLDKLIDSLQLMPGIGPVSATRIAYYLLDLKREEGIEMARTIEQSLQKIALCPSCRNYSDDGQQCEFCRQEKRRQSGLLCVVENATDVQAIERSGSFHGVYFVLHGRLSPLDGIGPEQLGFSSLKERLQDGTLKEVILAVSQTIEGNATAQFIAAMSRKAGLEVSRLATGVPIGGELTNVDEHTLENSFNYRRPFD
ncbi:MAG: recombination mediator RecR [Succinivibrio sp.]|nr:recombination mediator RecR [Succinivibrio sp.]